MQFSQPRLKSILLMLSSSLDGQYISVPFLASKFNVTTRTIRNDIKELNEQLADYKIGIKNKRGAGLYLNRAKCSRLTQLKKDLRATHDELSPIADYENRQKAFIVMLLNGETNIDEIINDLFISDSTFDKYLNEARKVLKTYDISLSKTGDHINVCGNEIAIRNCIVDNIDDKRDSKYVQGFTKLEKNLFQKIDLDYLSVQVAQLIFDLHLTLSDYNNKNIVIHMALELTRKTRDDHFSLDHAASHIKKKDRVIIEIFFEKTFKQYQRVPSKAELDYFVYHLALNYPQIIAENKSTRSIDDETIDAAIMAFLDRIKSMYVFDLLNDQQLKDNLRKHLQLLLRVKRIDGNRKNPLLNVIISTFPLAYEMTVMGSPILEKKLGLALNEDELSFITLHIGASMERLYDNRWDKKRIALVCGSGTATAQLLKARLEAEFSEYLMITGVYSLFEFQHRDLTDNDFIISTVPIYDSKLPVIQVDLSNFQKDSFELYQYLISISDKSKLIMSLFDSKLIYLLEGSHDKKEILDMLIKDQEKYHFVDSSFGKNVYEREKMYSTAIGGAVAIPHPIKYSAIQSKVSFVRLDEPIRWDAQNEVKYIFLLSINKDDYPNIQQLFTLLVNFQANAKFRRLIDKCKTVEETKDGLRGIVKRFV